MEMEKKKKIIGIVGIFIALIVFINLAFSDGGESKSHKGEAQTPSGSSIQKGKDYKDVVKEFEDSGFKNIKTKKLDDMITGWVTGDGEVKSVSVDGDKDYSPDDWYPNDVEVVITYHMSPEEKKSDTNSNGENNTEKTNTEKTNTEKTNTEKTNTEKTNTEKINTEKTNTEKTNTEKTNTEKTDTEKPNTERSIYEKAYRVRFQDYDICYLIDEDAHTVSVFDTTEEYTYIYTSAYTGDFNNGIDFEVNGLKHHAHYKYWDVDTTLIVADESGNENKAEKRDVDTIEKQIKLRP
ncbi:hypothetical protein G6549_24905 [Bacillus sp. MM2020_1]|nr:hypothetical protein [Bacillus sp. MM2020_1]